MSGALFILATSAAVQIGAWSTWDRVDPVTDLKGAAASVHSTDGRSHLLLTCDVTEQGRDLSLQFKANQYLGSDANAVQLRADADPPMENYWSFYGRIAVLAPDSEVRPALQKIRGASRLYVRAFDFNQQPVGASFDIAGASEAIATVLAACGKLPLK